MVSALDFQPLIPSLSPGGSLFALLPLSFPACDFQEISLYPSPGLEKKIYTQEGSTQHGSFTDIKMLFSVETVISITSILTLMLRFCVTAAYCNQLCYPGVTFSFIVTCSPPGYRLVRETVAEKTRSQPLTVFMTGLISSIPYLSSI